MPVSFGLRNWTHRGGYASPRCRMCVARSRNGTNAMSRTAAAESPPCTTIADATPGIARIAANDVTLKPLLLGVEVKVKGSVAPGRIPPPER